jgi:hypothetical protein
MAVQFDPFVPKPGSRERYLSETAPAVEDPNHDGKASTGKTPFASEAHGQPVVPPASPVPPREKGSGTGALETMLDRRGSGLRSGTGESGLG